MCNLLTKPPRSVKCKIGLQVRASALCELHCYPGRPYHYYDPGVGAINLTAVPWPRKPEAQSCVSSPSTFPPPLRFWHIGDSRLLRPRFSEEICQFSPTCVFVCTLSFTSTSFCLHSSVLRRKLPKPQPTTAEHPKSFGERHRARIQSR